MILASLLSVALAGPNAVYVNGVKLDRIPVVEMKNVSVRMDAAGNVWIDAPGYRVAVEPSTPAATSTPVATLPTSAPTTPTAGGLSPGSWWFVTEDDGSSGQTVEVYVNGTLARTVRSGEVQVVMDVSSLLRRGNNEIRFNTISDANIAGGNLTIYLGSGTTAVNGVVRLDSPDIRYQRRASEGLVSGQRTLTVNIP